MFRFNLKTIANFFRFFLFCDFLKFNFWLQIDSKLVFLLLFCIHVMLRVGDVKFSSLFAFLAQLLRLLPSAIVSFKRISLSLIEDIHRVFFRIKVGRAGLSVLSMICLS